VGAEAAPRPVAGVPAFDANPATMAHRPRILPGTLTSGEQRVLAAFLAGRLSAGRLQAELAEVRRAPPPAPAAPTAASLRAA
jgi:hypothetical protein